MTLAWVALLALGTVRFEPGPGCGDARAFEGLVKGDWELALGPQGAGWRLELSRGGERALVRELPAAESCKALAQAAELIVERYFREVAAGRVVAPAPRARPPPAIVVQPNVMVAEPNVVAAPDVAAAPNVIEAPSVVVARPNVVMQAEAAREAEVVREPEVAPPPPGVPLSVPPMVAVPVPEQPGTEQPRAEPSHAEPPRASVPPVSPPSTAPSREVPSTTEPTRMSVAPVAEEQTVEPPAPRGPRLVHAVDLSLGAGALVAPPSDAGAFFTAHAALKLGSRFRVGLLGGFATTSIHDVASGNVTRGTLWTTPFVVAAEGGACANLPVELCGSGFVGVRGAHGVASGWRLYGTTDAYLVAPDLGVLARAQWRPWRGLFLALEVWAAFPVGGGTFKIQDLANVGLPTLDVTGSLQLGWSFQIL